MKKFGFLLGLLALSLSFYSCDKKDDPKPPIEELVEDGFYVVGAATASEKLVTNATMSPGQNEVGQVARDGMYEKYIALEGGKPFSLFLKKGTTETKYGATLTNVDLDGTGDQPKINIQKGKLTENGTLQVAKSGLYHIVLDLNLKGDLAEPQILIAPVTFGLRGGMNSWGFTEMEASTFNKESMTFTVKGVEIKSTQEFKIAYGGGWKIQLDNDELVKANTNLGKDMKPGGDNMAVDANGVYTVTLTWTLKEGTVADGFVAKFDKTGELVVEFPETLYMIGADFGNWEWDNAGVADMIPVHGKDGEFWAVRYFTQANGFKWAPGKEWKDDFTGLNTNEGYTVADGNAFVPADGIYMVYVNFPASKITIEPAKVYLTGADLTGGWGDENATYLFTANGNKLVSPTFTAGGNLRIFATSSAKTSDWWTREFNVFNGKIEYRGTGNDQAAVVVSAGQKVTLDFNAGTGVIQ